MIWPSSYLPMPTSFRHQHSTDNDTNWQDKRTNVIDKAHTVAVEEVPWWKCHGASDMVEVYKLYLISLLFVKRETETSKGSIGQFQF